MTTQARMTLIGKRLRHLRLSNDLTLAEAGRGANIKAARYSNYEQGYRTPGLDEIELLAKFFKVPAAYLAGFIDEKEAGVALPSRET